MNMSDADFVGLFSPKILEKLPDDVFASGVHVLHSPPGGGKTTLFRAFTPGALRVFWNERRSPDIGEAIDSLEARGLMDDAGPRWLGILLSCAAGYADLPIGADLANQSLFRALFDCRTIQQTLRGLSDLLGADHAEVLDHVEIKYRAPARDLKSIPIDRSASELLRWAEQTERQLYAQMDDFSEAGQRPAHVRFESVIWLYNVTFIWEGREVAPGRLLMVDDLHKLRDGQRQFLIDEMTTMRPGLPIWLAQRSISFGSLLLSQGGRAKRDLSVYSLGDLWTSGHGPGQFIGFAESILDRRMSHQVAIRTHSFRSLMRGDMSAGEVKEPTAKAIKNYQIASSQFRDSPQYEDLIATADALVADPSVEHVQEIYLTRILIARHQRKRQQRLELEPLTAEDVAGRDSGKDRNAAAIFMSVDAGFPYYFGFDRVVTMATFNVQELLTLAAGLYEGMRAKQIMRHRDVVLSPAEQDKILRDVARQKLETVPSTHTEGTRAKLILTAIGEFCRQRTFEPNAPYAPGVTGISVTDFELAELGSMNSQYGAHGKLLLAVLSECVAENLLVKRPNAATGSRESGSIFYLNRTLCARFDLPLQHGGWQEISPRVLMEWMQRGAAVQSKKAAF